MLGAAVREGLLEIRRIGDTRYVVTIYAAGRYGGPASEFRGEVGRLARQNICVPVVTFAVF